MNELTAGNPENNYKECERLIMHPDESLPP